MNKRAVFSLIIGCVLLMSACNTGTTVKPGVSTATSSQTTTRELVGNTYKTGYPIVKDKIELSVMLMKGADTGDFNKMKFASDYEAKTNVKIKWISVDISRMDEATQVMYNTGNYPDIYAVWGSIKDTHLERYGVKEKKIMELTDEMLTKWAPNISGKYKDQPMSKKSVIRSNGKMYSIPMINNDQQVTYLIRKSWLENLDLKVPTTTEEFYNVLKKFKEGDPNGNGEKDEIPFAFAQYDPGLLFNPWGLQLTWGKYISIDTKGKFHFAMTTNAFKDGLTYWKKLYDENLYDKGTADGTTKLLELVKTGKVGVTYWISVLHLEDTRLANDFIPMATPKATTNLGDFQPGVNHFSLGINPASGYFLSAKNKNVEASLRWIDFFYSNQGEMYKDYGGEPGKYYEIMDGKFLINYKALPGGMAPNQDTPGYTLHGSYQLKDGELLRQDASKLTEIEKAGYKVEDAVKPILISGKPTVVMPFLAFDLKEAEAVYSGNQAVNSAIHWGTAAIKGEKLEEGAINPLTNWSGFVSEWNRRGALKLVEMYQKKYDATK